MSSKPDWGGASNVAPRRRVVMPHPPWKCSCLVEEDGDVLDRRTNPGYLVACPECKALREES